VGKLLHVCEKIDIFGQAEGFIDANKQAGGDLISSRGEVGLRGQKTQPVIGAWAGRGQPLASQVFADENSSGAAGADARPAFIAKEAGGLSLLNFV